jgi:hypothetical protein
VTVTDEKQAEQRLKEDMNYYAQSLLALKGLAHEFAWDDASRELRADVSIWFGRKMDVTESNFKTPDLIVQLSPKYGVVADAKITVPKEDAHLQELLKKLTPYTRRLKGWDTGDGHITNHDFLVVVHQARGNRVARIAKNMIDEGTLSFERPFGLIKFNINDQAKSYLALELVYGSISDVQKQSKFCDTVMIELAYIAQNPDHEHVRLYDAEPPTPYLMDMIHEWLLQTLTEQETETKAVSGEVLKRIDLTTLREGISEFYGPGHTGERVPEIPQKKWVKRAVSQFVKKKWASKLDGETETYEFIIKTRINPLDQFVRICAKDQIKDAKSKPKPKPLPQLDLFQ